MKTKEETHTPGPWANNDSYDSVRGADGEVVCHTFGAVDPVEMSNAKLIAAAPEMLEALVEARGFISNFTNIKGEGGTARTRRAREAYVQIADAISKATEKEEGR